MEGVFSLVVFRGPRATGDTARDDRRGILTYETSVLPSDVRLPLLVPSSPTKITRDEGIN